MFSLRFVSTDLSPQIRREDVYTYWKLASNNTPLARKGNSSLIIVDALKICDVFSVKTCRIFPPLARRLAPVPSLIHIQNVITLSKLSRLDPLLHLPGTQLTAISQSGFSSELSAAQLLNKTLASSCLLPTERSDGVRVDT
jgi:hypothetical protein